MDSKIYITQHSEKVQNFLDPIPILKIVRPIFRHISFIYINNGKLQNPYNKTKYVD